MATDKRQRLTDAAVELSHRSGLASSSLATIAEAADVPVGNVYYYFKTKDDLVEAVIESRSMQYAELRRSWDDASHDPTDRLVAFVDHTRATADELTAHGCPVGGLCHDVARTNPPLAPAAARVFEDTIDWAGTQLSSIGHPDPSAGARRLVAVLQGATLLAHATGDSELLVTECTRLEDELRRRVDQL